MKYVVEVKEVHNSICEIESKTPLTRTELLCKAEGMIQAGESGCLEYDRTMDSDAWTTRTEDGDFVV